MSVKGPGLVKTVVAVPEDNMVMVVVSVSMNIQALAWNVSKVSSITSIVGNSLLWLTSVLSNDSGSVNVESLSLLVRDSIVSSSVSSDGSGSSVEYPPLLVVPWLMILDSQSVLMSSNMLMPEEGSVSTHSRSDLESDSVIEWLSWPLDVSLI